MAAEEPPPPKKSRDDLYTKNALEGWKGDFTWLTEDHVLKGNVQCKLCKVSMKGERTGIRKHAEGNKHKKRVEAMEDAISTTGGGIGKFTKQSTTRDPVKIFELRIAATVACKAAFRTVDDITDLMKVNLRDPLVLGLKLKRTKCGKLCTNVISPSFLKELLQDIGDVPFSLLIDESTDVSTAKLLALVIRYYSRKKRDVVTVFYRLVLAAASDSTALVKSIVEVLKEDNLNVKNLFGIGTDGANVMVGVNHSVYSQLKDVQPDLVLITCVCHSLHLCASYSVRGLPMHLEFMSSETYNWFARSSKKYKRYNEIALTVPGVDPIKFTRACDTRWLSLVECDRRIVKSWDALAAYFEEAAGVERNQTCTLLAGYYKDPCNYAYMMFLLDYLRDFHRLNLTFQADNANVFKLLDDLRDMFLNLAERVVKPEVLAANDSSLLGDFRFDENTDFMDHRDIKVDYGYDFMSYLNSKVPPQCHDVMKERCRNVLVQGVLQVQKRLPPAMQNLTLIRFLSPDKIMTGEAADIKPLLDCFKSVAPHPDVAIPLIKCIARKQWSSRDPVKFWIEVLEYTNSEGSHYFEPIAIFALGMLCLPFSNAAVERVFSIMNIVKSKTRNRLLCETVECIIRIRSAIPWRNDTAANMVVTADMLSRFNSAIYDTPKPTVGDENMSPDCVVLDEICDIINEDADMRIRLNL